MALRRKFAAGLASFVVAVAVIGTVPGSAVATANAPAEVATLPVPQLAAYRQDTPLVAGVTGFLHQEQDLSGYIWTDYASGADSVQTHMAGLTLASTHFMSVGGDFLAYQSGATLTVGSPVTGSWVDYTLPQSGTVNTLAAAVDGTRALVHEGDGMHLLGLNADGTVADVAVTGLPEGSGYTATPIGFQGPGDVAVVRLTPTAGSSFAAQLALLRMDTATAYPIPSTAVPATASARVSGGYLLWSTNVFHALKTDDVMAGTAGAPLTVARPTGTSTFDYAVVGQQIVLLTQPTPATPEALYSLPLDGEPAVQLDAFASQLTASVPQAPYVLAQGAGGVLTVGGTASDQAVQRLTAADDGSVTVSSVRPLPPPAESTATLSMVHGLVRQVLTVPQFNAATRFAMATTPLAGPVTGSPRAFTGYMSAENKALQPGPCAVDATCVRETDGSFYGPMYTTTTATSAQVFIPGLSVRENFSSPDTHVVDADLDYVVIDSAGTQYLWQPGQGEMITLGAVSGAAMWMDTLWRATAPGRIQASRPQNGLGAAPAVQRTISTGASCTPSEVQVAQHWLYWSCADGGPAGVYDLATGAEFAVGAGPATLGDGYLVRHDGASGELLLTDLHADSVGATSALAALPQRAGVDDDRGIDWTVDRTTGDVAYTGADNIVHVLTTGVPVSPVTAQAGAWNNAITPGEAWNFGFSASRPLASWQLVVRRATTGEVVYSYTGGPTTVSGGATWNGKRLNGSAAFDGDYHWQLLAVPADSPAAAPTQAASGTVAVFYGRMPFHSYGENGLTTLLGVLNTKAFGYSPGYGVEYTGNGRGGYPTRSVEGYWNMGSGSRQTNAVVPFGDLNGDGFNDFVVRTGAGVLEYYPNGPMGETFNAATPKVIGKGWNIYNRLISTGDLNRDGHDDLLARDAAGALWLYRGTGKGSFNSRILLGKGWNSYTKIVGVGDVNGDGNGDLVAVDTAGGLWRYLGNGKGSFGKRVRIGTGYQVYNTLAAVGDVNGHGLNSFVARDAKGVLWRFDFTATGSLQARVRVGSGWNMYSALY
ncbi:FG-GAP repeat domain-containing protein [Streptacidiphilus sp. N1-3]|uniref:FG-GAP repeat domain-containing protein n=1 Tax=Streptacidiphilus alkalitolerans TaxID=3342712 RepID=A0ABV6WY86_9ACTN